MSTIAILRGCLSCAQCTPFIVSDETDGVIKIYFAFYRHQGSFITNEIEYIAKYGNKRFVW